MTEEKNLFMGIDPGKTGAISIIDDSGAILFCEVIPTIKKKVVNYNDINDILTEWSPRIRHAGFEDNHAQLGRAAGSTFEFGHITGFLYGLLIAYKIPHTLAKPAQWQKEMWQGCKIIKKKSSTGKTMVNDTKATSEIAAMRLYPGYDFRKSDLAKNPHDGKIDATLIAEYTRRKIVGS